jgi:hypothetical protein
LPEVEQGDPDRDILELSCGVRGIAAQPSELREHGVSGWEGGMAFDVTKTCNIADHFTRPHYPVDKIDLKKWFAEEQIKNIRSIQTDYAKALAKRGW